MASLPDEIPQAEMCNDLPVMKIKTKISATFHVIFVKSRK